MRDLTKVYRFISMSAKNCNIFFCVEMEDFNVFCFSPLKPDLKKKIF